VGTPRSAIPGCVAANLASCRVTHCAKPAFGQRGLRGPSDQKHVGVHARRSELARDLLIFKSGAALSSAYPLLRSRPPKVPALRRATLKSAKWPNAYAPTTRCFAVARHTLTQALLRGPPRSAIPGRVAANPASCRVSHCAKPAFGQRGLRGPLDQKPDQTIASKLAPTGP